MTSPTETGAPRPPLDPEYAARLESGEILLLRTIGPEDIAQLRAELAGPPIEDVLGDRRIRHEEVVIPGSGMPATVLMPESGRPVRGCVFAIHGGGLIVGDRRSGLVFTLDWVERLGLAVVSPEYRLAPEHPYPAALSDCEHAYAWARDVLMREWPGVPLLLSGVSAGGGLAAALTVALVERGEPVPAGLLLQAPMLDHRNGTTSARQFSGTGQWDRESNATGWSAYLGSVPAAQVTGRMSPALAADLTGFPPTFIDVGSAEVFRDEDVAFASALWAAGVEAQLAVWPGGIHGFDRMTPETAIGRDARAVREGWLTRIFQL